MIFAIFACMNERPPALPRSPMLMSAHDTALLVIDMQEKLTGLINGYERLVWNTRRLIDAAKLYDVPVLGSEQYPKGLGGTVPELADQLDSVSEKVRFSCGGCPELFDGLLDRGIRKILIAGLETHVCVLQTTLDLMMAEFDVFVCVDAVGARFPVDHRVGLRRMEANGVTLVTAESAMFEWCEAAGTDKFKELSAIVRRTPPGDG